MSDDYRDGCSKRIGWTLLMLPWALFMLARDGWAHRSAAKWVACQNCHGNGTVLVEVKPGRWETRTCHACGGSGKVNTGLV